MRLYEEIFKDTDGAFAGAKCIFVPKGRGYFEGVRSVGEFTEERVLLRLKSCELEIVGKALSIAKYCDGDLALDGEIYAVQVLLENGV
jgi:hypothetical protein